MGCSPLVVWETTKDQVGILVWIWQLNEHQAQILPAILLGFSRHPKKIDISLRFLLLSAFSAILVKLSALSCSDISIYNQYNTVFWWNLSVNLPLIFMKLAYINEFSHLFKSMLLKSDFDSMEVSRNHIYQQRIVQVFQNYSHFKSHFYQNMVFTS